MIHHVGNILLISLYLITDGTRVPSMAMTERPSSQEYQSNKSSRLYYYRVRSNFWMMSRMILFIELSLFFLKY